MRRLLILGICGWIAGCQRGEPPAPTLDAAVAPLPPPPALTSLDAGIKDSAVTVAVNDAGEEPGSLPQTKDKPAASGAGFDARVAAFWDGIVSDDVDRALPFFFPLKAYEQVKDVGNPASDWKRRLVAAYRRDIHALHKRLGDHASTAKFVRIEVPDERARWVEPAEEYNKLGYYRVYGTRVVYSVDDKERSFDVSSLISWRGEWYVVHLTGFK